MIDVALALGVASERRLSLSRIQLQKFVYLLDVLGTIYQFLPAAHGHETYQRGPYDPAIQNAVDCMAFRGFVSIEKIKSISTEAKQASYGLTAAGREWLGAVSCLESAKPRWEAARDIADSLDVYGWQRLVPLVYAEPTYSSARPQGFGQRLHPENALNKSAAALIHLVLVAIPGNRAEHPLSKSVLSGIFFRYLDAYSRATASNGGRGNIE